METPAGLRTQDESVLDLAEFWKRDHLSDCRVKCGNRVWNLHRLVLCERSKFFDKAFCGAFVESKTNEVDLVDQDPEHVEWALRCIYSGNLAHIMHIVKVVDDEMTAYRHCLELYKLGDFLDSDVICDAVLDALEYNNKRRTRTVQRGIGEQIAEALNAGQCHPEVDTQPFLGFCHSFVNHAKMAYSLPERNSIRDGLFNLPARGIKATFTQLMWFLRHLLLPGSCPDLVRKLQELPELLGDTLMAIQIQPDWYTVPQIQVAPVWPSCPACDRNILGELAVKSSEATSGAGDTEASSSKSQGSEEGANFWLAGRCFECIESGKEAVEKPKIIRHNNTWGDWEYETPSPTPPLGAMWG